MPISICIVEDDRKTRENLAKLLDAAPELKCLKTYGNGEEAVNGIPGDKPDVALVDINLPGMNGIQCVSKLKTALPDLRVLMLTMYEERDLIFDSLRAGAQGYLLKKASPAELIQAVEQVQIGGAPMSMQIARKVVDYFHRIPKTSPDIGKLTPREQEILGLLAKGCYYKEISERLGISIFTVKSNVQHIYDKLHVTSRTAATLKFFGKQ